MIDIVEYQPGDGYSTEEFFVGRPASGFARKGDAVGELAGVGQPLKLGTAELHRPADEGTEPGGTCRTRILQCAQRQKVVDALSQRLDMAIYHRSSRTHPKRVSLPHHVEPLPGRRLGRRQESADTVGEDFGAGAGQRVEPGYLQALQHFAVRQAADTGDVGNFRRTERVESKCRFSFFQLPEESLIPLDAVAGMQPALQQKLVAAECFQLGDFRQIVFERQGISLFRLVGPAVEIAEFAAGKTDVGVVDVAVDLIADALLGDVRIAGGLRLSAEFVERCVAIERQGFVFVQTFHHSY